MTTDFKGIALILDEEYSIWFRKNEICYMLEKWLADNNIQYNIDINMSLYYKQDAYKKISFTSKEDLTLFQLKWLK